MTMTDKKKPLELDQNEASLALYALRFYKSAKRGEVGADTLNLEGKLDEYLEGTNFIVTQVENVASVLGARGGAKGGASTSDAKRAAAAANGSRGGRPHKPNLFIKFTKAVWQEPDPKLLNELYRLAGTNTWLPDEVGQETEGPYVRMYVPELTEKLKTMLRNSMNVWEWDNQGLYRYCEKHANKSAKALTAGTRAEAICTICSNPALFIY